MASRSRKRGARPDLLLDAGSPDTYQALTPKQLVSEAVRGVLVYTGGGRTTRTWCEDVIAAGIGVGWIQERVNSWAQGGAPAARTDIDFASSRMWCSPSQCRTWFAASDGTSSTPGPGRRRSWDGARAGIFEYGRTIGAGWPGRIGGYGNVACLDAFVDGVRAANPLADVRTWIPCFWNPRPSDLLWQYGHRSGVGDPSPFDETDADYVVNGTLADVGLWGGAAPKPLIPKEYDMLIRNAQTGARLATSGFDTFSYRNLANLPQEMFIPLDDDEWIFTINALADSKHRASGRNPG